MKIDERNERTEEKLRITMILNLRSEKRKEKRLMIEDCDDFLRFEI